MRKKQATARSWVILFLAILLETVGTICMKMSQGFTVLIPSLLILPLYGASFAFLALTLRDMEISVAYAIWSGVGTALIALIGIFSFHEDLSFLKIASVFCIVVGVVGLNLASHK